MTYLSDREKRKKKIISRSLIAISLVVLISFWTRIRDVLTPVSYSVTSEMFVVSEFFANVYDAAAHFFTSKEILASQIDELEKENDALKQELAVVKEASSTTTGFDDVHHVEVRSLYSSLSTIYDSFIISKGFSEGVTQGMMVYMDGYLPVGMVDEVHPSTSRVVLLSRPGNELEGFIATSSIMVRLVGNGGGDFMAVVPKQVSISVGSPIYMKENPHMLLGTVVAIENEPQSVSQQLYVRGAYTVTLHKRLYIDLP